jgi:glycerate 2-kinase
MRDETIENPTEDMILRLDVRDFINLHNRTPERRLIRNRRQLSSKGNAEGRRAVIDIIDYALRSVDSYEIIKRLVNVRNGTLRVGSYTYDLAKIGEVYVVGAGKQVSYVAAALEDVLGERISAGTVIEKRGGGRRTRRILVMKGRHPIPDESCVKGAERILEMIRKAHNDDLVIACVTGGCTALTALPPSGIPLKDIQKTYSLLFKSGMPLHEMNTIRTHVSQLGGGKLAKFVHTAETLGLIAVDEIENRPWGPTVPDPTTFGDARKVLSKYGLWTRIPSSVRKYMERADPFEETPKRIDFEEGRLRIRNVVFADNKMLCSAAAERARHLGLSVSIFSTRLEGEAKEAGTVLAERAMLIEEERKHSRRSHAFIVGGETTVTITGKAGSGGRNQELALAAAAEISGHKGIVLASIGTDGTDGPTDIAGAIVDGYSFDQAQKSGVNIPSELRKHNSAHVFRRLKDAIYVSDTRTNLMDLIVVYIQQKSSKPSSGVTHHWYPSLSEAAQEQFR